MTRAKVCDTIKRGQVELSEEMGTGRSGRCGSEVQVRKSDVINSVFKKSEKIDL